MAGGGLPGDCDDLVTLHVVRNELHGTADQPHCTGYAVARTHLHGIEVAVDDDVVVARSDTTIPQLLSL